MVELVRLVALLPASDVDATYRKKKAVSGDDGIPPMYCISHACIMVLRRLFTGKLTVEYIAYISRWRPAQAEPTPLPLELGELEIIMVGVN